MKFKSPNMKISFQVSNVGCWQILCGLHEFMGNKYSETSSWSAIVYISQLQHCTAFFYPAPVQVF